MPQSYSCWIDSEQAYTTTSQQNCGKGCTRTVTHHHTETVSNWVTNGCTRQVAVVTNYWYCSTCPAGKWSNPGHIIGCNVCVEGKYSSEGGRTSADFCVACPAGKYSAIAASSCTDCMKGKYTPDAEANSACSTCAEGKIAPSTGMASCQDCAAGRYNSDPAPLHYTLHDADEHCVECAAGKFSSTGSSGEHPNERTREAKCGSSSLFHPY